MVNKRLISQIHEAVAKEPKIKLVYVLGSIVSGREKIDSDFDLAVVVDDATKIRYGQIYQLISGLSFPRDLDLSIVNKKSSPLFLFQITSSGRCVYQRSDADRVTFEAFVMHNYYDTAHLRNIYYSYLKNKFSYAG